MDKMFSGTPHYDLIIPAKNRISFIYFEYGTIQKENNSLTFRQADREFDIPAANLLAILLGTGTSITQPAVQEISRWGCNISFVAGGGVGLHSSFISSSSKTAHLINKQAKIVSTPDLRIYHARKMYEKRWGKDSIPKNYSINKMMMLEGRRMKDLYRKESLLNGINNFQRQQKISKETDLSNQIITMFNHMLYGLVNSVTVSLGLSPALGIIHYGHAKSFIFDIADLYKEQYIKLAFQLAGQHTPTHKIRGIFRTKILQEKTIEQIIDDILDSLSINDFEQEPKAEESFLWTKNEIIKNEGYSLDER